MEAPEQLTDGQAIQPGFTEWELKRKNKDKGIKKTKMNRGRQMETNDSGIPGVVRGAANRWETDYISLTLSSLCFPPSLVPVLSLFQTHFM